LLTEEKITVMGIKEWLVPQISEHCPTNNPIRLDDKKIWFRRPGRASTFIPIEGTVQEWITSADLIKERISVLTGNCKFSLVFIRRKMLELSIKFSISLMLIVLYS